MHIRYNMIIFAALVGCALCAEEVQRNASDDKSAGVLKKSDQKQTESTFMSKIANWMFPFGSGDSEAAEGNTNNQYLPPPSQQGLPNKECNPCNQEPWIPVAANYGKNTIIGFMQPHEYDQAPHATSIDEFRPPGINGGYGSGGFIGHNNNQIHVQQNTNYAPGYYDNAASSAVAHQNFGQNLLPNQPLINEPTYGPPKPIYDFPRPRPPKNFAPPQFVQNRPPPQNYIPVKLKPSVQYTINHPPPKNLPTNMLPPPLAQGGFYKPSLTPPRSYPAPNFDSPFRLPQITKLKPQVTNPDYLPPLQQLPIQQPIPLPNLSGGPVAPIHNAQPFRDSYASPGGNQPYRTNNQGSSVEIVQSIPVADYLATIEHPINVIRSPILEVNVANTSSLSDNGYNNVAEKTPQNSYTSPAPDAGYSSNSLGSYNNDAGTTTGYSNTGVNGGSYRDVSSGGDFKNIKNGVYSGFKDLGAMNYNDAGSYRNTDYQDPPSDYIYKNANYNGKLSDNPIVVDDTSVAASSYNGSSAGNPAIYNNLGGDITPEFINQIINGHVGKDFNAPNKNTFLPTLVQETSTAYPRWSDLATSMMPPPVGQSLWLTTTGQGHVIQSTTKKPKQIQIIIPYTTNKKTEKPSLPMYTQPPNTESVWMQHKYDTSPTQRPHTTQVINIKDLFKDNQKDISSYKNLPFDIIRFQKNIDGWTEQEFANKMLIRLQKATTTTRLVPSKKIPDEYLTTLPYSENEVTTSFPKDFFDHEPAGTNSKEYHYKNDVETNLITEPPTTTTQKHPKSWDKIQISVSPLTKEKIYVVTPQPVASELSDNSTSKFSITIMPMKNKTENGDVRVVLSEWPHLINNLATTTTPKPKPSRHPLFGLMDLSSYAPPANATIQTYSGHSKVINAVTSTSSTKKKIHSDDAKKTTTPKSSTTTLKNT